MDNATTTPPAALNLDALFDAEPALAGRVAAVVLHGRRFPVTDDQYQAITALVDGAEHALRTFRDGAELWMERRDG